MPRFVVLYHETPDDDQRPSHWDLMLEDGAALRTWALAEAPRCGATVTAMELPDHRAEYLDYEGPLSRGRGSVSRWDGGQYAVRRDSPESLTVRLNGNQFSTDATISRSSKDQRCTISFSATNDI